MNGGGTTGPDPCQTEGAAIGAAVAVSLAGGSLTHVAASATMSVSMTHVAAGPAVAPAGTARGAPHPAQPRFPVRIQAGDGCD